MSTTPWSRRLDWILDPVSLRKRILILGTPFSDLQYHEGPGTFEPRLSLTDDSFRSLTSSTI